MASRARVVRDTAWEDFWTYAALNNSEEEIRWDIGVERFCSTLVKDHGGPGRPRGGEATPRLCQWHEWD